MRGNYNYIYFNINHKINKIFILSEERNLEIISTELYNNKDLNQYFYPIIITFNCLIFYLLIK